MAKVFRNGRWETIDMQPNDFPIEEYMPTREEIIAEKQAQIDSYKAELSASDYKAIKYAEGLISAEDYEPIKAHRQALRDEINRLENELKV